MSGAGSAFTVSSNDSQDDGRDRLLVVGDWRIVGQLQVILDRIRDIILLLPERGGFSDFGPFSWSLDHVSWADTVSFATLVSVPTCSNIPPILVTFFDPLSPLSHLDV